MKYCQENHDQQQRIEYLCINSECVKYPFCCKKCEKKLHDSHRKDCVDLEDYEQRFQTMLQTQTSLQQRLQTLMNSISKKFQTIMQQLETNVTTIQQLSLLIKEKQLVKIQEKIDWIKYLNSLDNDGLNNAGFQIGIGINSYRSNRTFYQILKRMPQVIYLAIHYLLIIKNEKWEEAIKFVDKALKFDDQQFKLYAWRAKALQRNQKKQFIRYLENYEEAQKYLDQGLEHSQNDPDLLREQGNLLFFFVNKKNIRGQKKYEKAIELFQKSLQIEPENLEALDGIGLQFSLQFQLYKKDNFRVLFIILKFVVNVIRIVEVQRS